MLSYSEQDIILGCKENKRVFQEALFKQYHSLFLKICARYAIDNEDTEQLLHDGFLKIFTHIEEYKFAGSFEGWMKRIVVNNCLDYVKSKDTRNALNTKYALPVEEVNTSFSASNVLKDIAFKDLLKLIQTLPPTTRMVFNLAVFEGYSHKEIASLLKISEGTSSWHLHEARKTLQKLILKSSKEANYESK